MRTLFTRLAVILLLVSAFNGYSQSKLDQYVADGLKNNVVLQQRHLALDRAIQALRIANGMFMPSVAFQANYTHGVGGRNISLPIGDLLNPVYSTLNALTESNQFPQIENVNQTFFPRNFYDVRLRTSVPIINSDLLYNKKIQAQQVVLQEFEVDAYKRELIKEIQVAYFNYLSAVEAIGIYESALTRALESKRVNESLLANGKGLPAYILRADSEVENIKSQLTQATKQSDNAKLYFNFLLNRDATETIDADVRVKDKIQSITQDLAAQTDVAQREEIKQVRELSALQENVLKMNKLFWSPRLGAFADVGSQYENWVFNDQSRYLLVGLQLDIPIFAGYTNRYKINQARIDVQNSKLNLSNVERQLQMSATVSRNNVESSYQNYQSSLKQREAASTYQRLIEKGYKEGVNTFIETIDAQNQLTSAQLLVSINEYKLLAAKAAYERETATNNIQ